MINKNTLCRTDVAELGGTSGIARFSPC